MENLFFFFKSTSLYRYSVFYLRCMKIKQCGFFCNDFNQYELFFRGGGGGGLGGEEVVIHNCLN